MACVVSVEVRAMVRRRTRTRKKPARGAPTRHRNGWVLAILTGLVVVNLYVFVWDKKTSIAAIQGLADNPPAMRVGDRPLENLEPVGADGHATGGATHVTPGVGSSGSGGTGGTAGTARRIDGKVAKSDTVGRLLKRNGLTGKEADEVIRALAPVADLRVIQVGAAFTVERGVDGRVASFELAVGRTRVRAIRDASGALVGAVTSAASH
jgi:hypothetical protein